MKILCIGDQHIKLNNLDVAKIICEKLKKFLQTYPVDIIVSLGDLLHTHERLHTLPLNVAISYLSLLSQFAPTYVLIGNHDFINSSQFLTENHWLNCVKNINNLNIVDKIYEYNKDDILLVFSPYVPDGRFVEALNTIGDRWKMANCIFGHQALNGGKMGSKIIENVEDWEKEYPLLISGHLHIKQIISENMRYIGSICQESFGDETEKSICLLTLNKGKNPIFEEYYLDFPKKKTLYTDTSNFDSFVFHRKENTEYKIVISCFREEFKTIQHSQKYKELSKVSKIVPNFKLPEKKMVKTQSKSFTDILYDLVKENNNLCGIFDEFVR